MMETENAPLPLGVSNERVDAAIRLIRSCYSEETQPELPLSGTGLKRILSDYYGRGPSPNPTWFPRGWSRDRHESLATAIGAICQAQPGVFLDEVEAGRIPLATTQTISVLGGADDPRALPLLLPFAKHENSGLRIGAISALAARSHELQARATVEHVMVHDENWTIRVDAASAISRWDPELAYSGFRAVLAHPMLPPQRRAMVEAEMTRDIPRTLRDDRTSESLVTAVGDDDWAERFKAVQTLAYRRDPETRGALEAALDDESVSVRYEAARAVSDWNPPLALNALQAMLDSPEVSSSFKQQIREMIPRISPS